MNLQELSANNALIAGSDFWVIPDSSNSQWVKRIDWHCNFQLSKTQFKELKFLPDLIKKISAEQEYGLKDIRCTDDSPIMIVGETYFPCKYVIQLPYSDKETWLNKIRSIQKGLRSKKARIFLPRGFSQDEFFALSRDIFDTEDEFSFVIS